MTKKDRSLFDKFPSSWEGAKKGAQRLKNLRRKHSWITYLILFFVVPSSLYLFCNFQIFHTDINGSYYLLSVLVQSEATVIALVVTLSFIVAQLTTSSYHPIVFKYFRKSPDFWILMISYVLTIVYSLFVLKAIRNTDTGVTPHIHINLACSFGFFCFLALIPYIYDLPDKVKPSTIIRNSATDINKRNLLEKDPVYPIITIINKSLQIYDTDVSIRGVKEIRDRMVDVFINDRPEKKQEDRIADKVLKCHLRRIAKSGIQEKDRDFMVELNRAVFKMGEEALKRRLYSISYNCMWLLGVIGTSTAEKEQVDVTSDALNHLCDLNSEVLDELKSFPKINQNEETKNAKAWLDLIIKESNEVFKNISNIAKEKKNSDKLHQQKWQNIEKKAMDALSYNGKSSIC